MTSTMLFQYDSATENSTVTTCDQMFVAPDGGITMLTALWLCPGSGGTSNVVRIHHAKNLGTPTAANMIYRGMSSFRNTISDQYASVKLIMEPGDVLYGALHSGDAIVITGYGILSSGSVEASQATGGLPAAPGY